MRWLLLVAALVLVPACQRGSSDEVEKAKAEAVKARAEADRARAEADKARAEADKARAEADLQHAQAQAQPPASVPGVAMRTPVTGPPSSAPEPKSARVNCAIEDWDPYERKCLPKKAR